MARFFHGAGPLSLRKIKDRPPHVQNTIGGFAVGHRGRGQYPVPRRHHVMSEQGSIPKRREPFSCAQASERGEIDRADNQKTQAATAADAPEGPAYLARGGRALTPA
tara:strand:- start:1832 stop:2152 length:321 start_codon:yes stop_codon:yes gene_type:complete